MIRATQRQLVAYIYCYAWRMSQREAAIQMGITNKNVNKLLKRLKVKNPGLFEIKLKRTRRPRTYSFIENIDSEPRGYHKHSL